MSAFYHAIQSPLFVFSKTCPACIPPTEKSIDEFAKDRTRPDGHAVYCKVCNCAKISAIQVKGTAAYAKKLAYNRVYGRTHKRAGKSEYNRAYRVSHPVTEEERVARNAYGLAYAKRHPKKMAETAMRRYVLQKALTVQKVDYERILEHDGMYCYICEKDILLHHKLQFDHVIPLRPRPGEPAGTHTEENIKPTHSTCNHRKGNRHFEDLTPYQRRGVN